VDLPNSTKSVKVFIDKTLAGKRPSVVMLRYVALQDYLVKGKKGPTGVSRMWLVAATGVLGASLYLYQMYYGRRRGVGVWK